MRTHGPWFDLHAHPGRCFLADGTGARGADAIADIRLGGMAAVTWATVSDRLVLSIVDSAVRAHRDFEPREAYTDHRRQLDGIAGELAALGLDVARNAQDIVDAHERGESAAVLACEGGDFVEGDLGRIEEAHAAGVRLVTLVHYRQNNIGDLQTEPPRHGGLSDAGRDVVRELNRLGMIVDLAHATEQTTLDAIEVSSVPIVVSHSHLAAGVGSHARLLRDAHARAVADAGGVIGAWPAGVACSTLDDFVDEIVRLVDLVGVRHVAIGTDMDANYKPVLTAYAQFADVDERLRTRGLTTADADAVLGGNALDLFRRVCG